MLSKKFWRDSFVQLLLQLMLEYMVMVVIMIFANPYNAFLSGLFGLIALYVLRCANELLKIIVSTPAYYMSKKRTVTQVVAQFYHYNLPVRSDLTFLGGSEYMQEIANSHGLSEELKRYLNRSLGELDGLRSAGMVAFLRSNAILDAAIERYVSENNAQGKHIATP
jgi:hypothetical protein